MLSGLVSVTRAQERHHGRVPACTRRHTRGASRECQTTGNELKEGKGAMLLTTVIHAHF